MIMILNNLKVDLEPYDAFVTGAAPGSCSCTTYYTERRRSRIATRNLVYAIRYPQSAPGTYTYTQSVL